MGFKHSSVAQLILVICLFVAKAQADPRCFAFAETYYEQLYCEIKAQSPRAVLPEFIDFKRNPALTQALLLKPQGRSLGIKVELPKQKTNRVSLAAKHVSRPLLAGREKHSMAQEARVADEPGCEFSAGEIRCGNSVYRLQGNMANSDLVEGALSATNRLLLPEYSGLRGDEIAEQRYLMQVYKLYLEKMLAIGLAGATLNYGKFAYLFHDLNEQNVSFVERFGTMYEFLKKDKRNTRISTQPRLPQSLSDKDCYYLNPMWVCSISGLNYIYRL